MGKGGRHETRRLVDCSLIFVITLLFGGCLQARAEPIVELSGAAGFGALVVGVTPGRFSISPSTSLSVRGERWFFVARDTVSFLGATGGRFGSPTKPPSAAVSSGSS